MNPLGWSRPLFGPALAMLAIGPALCAAAPPSFETEIKPLLQTYCFSCHGPEKPKGEVNLSEYQEETQVQEDPKFWQNVLAQLSERAMPPAKKPQPTPAERDLLIEWIEHALRNIDYSKIPKDPGRVTIRRLNRAEYNNTVRDLFGVRSEPADTFPADGSGGAGFDNNADTLYIPPILLEQYLAAASEVLNDALPERIFIARPGDELSERGAAVRILEHIAPRAFRRPIEPEELERFVGLFERARQRGDTFQDAVKLPLKAMLVSPHFLFRIEKDQSTSEAYRISDYELASRLSYFIWCSMPDDELFSLAAEGRLHEPEVLEAQVRRMLKSPKSKALAEQFGGQWLGFRQLLTVAQPDPERFPQFTPNIRDAMYREAVEFVDSVFREDRSILTFIDADYAFLNEELARHYGIPDVKGYPLQRIALADRKRGGVLGLGAVLTVTSYPLRTSPVLRGKWVLEEILGAPPPPPPPDVPELPDDEASTDGLSFRQRLELHRANPECASCHNRMDPLGFGLENYDPIGRWRDQQGRQPVDVAGTLATGETFTGPGELKEVLLARKEAFARNLAEKMLSYALGRGLERYDLPAVKAVTDALERTDYRGSVLMVEIARSYPFQHRRNP